MLRLYKITGVHKGTRKRRNTSNKKMNLKKSKSRSGRRKTKGISRGRSKGRGKGKGKGKGKRRKGRKTKRRGGNGKLAGQQYSDLINAAPVSGMNTLPPQGTNSNPYFTSPGYKLSAINSALATPGNISASDHATF